MRVFTRPEAFREAGSADPLWLTLGTFDGLHRGHQALIEQLKYHAAVHVPRAVAMVVTFVVHPKIVLAHQPPQPIVSVTHKLKLLDEAGVDAVLLLDFDDELARVSADDFVQKWLVEKLGVAGVLLGYDNRFGHKARGDFALLARMASELGFVAERGEECRIEGETVSSTAVRHALQTADLDRAKMLLGRPFSTIGMVVEGDRRGRTIGVPTANFDVGPNVLVPLGVYVVNVRWLAHHPDTAHPEIDRVTALPRTAWGVANLGVRPTVTPNERRPRLEVHLFDFSDDIYGQWFEIEFHHFLRPEKSFESFAALREQIAADIAAAKALAVD